MNFDEVKVEEFTRISSEVPPHRKIEAALVDLGGKGVAGNAFKRDALKAAGWGYGKMTSYGAKPEAAAKAFNRLREALAHADSADALIAALTVEAG